jgi:hypothetical protein
MSIDTIARRIQAYQSTAGAYDQWEHGGRSSASDELIDKMDSELAAAKADADAAKAELAGLSAAERAQFQTKYPDLA